MFKKIDYILCDKFQYIVSFLTNRGFNAARVFFNVSIFATIIEIMFYLIQIGMKAYSNINFDIFYNLLFLFLSTYIVTKYFTIEFYKIAKYFDKKSENNFIIINKHMYKGTLLGILFRFSCLFLLMRVPSDIIRDFHDILYCIDNLSYFHAISEFFDTIYAILYTVISFASGCDYTKPKPPKNKTQKQYEIYSAA